MSLGYGTSAPSGFSYETDAQKAARERQNTLANMSANCANIGGFWDAFANKCIMPSAPVSNQAPANITVSPVIQTQISPQISPAFQQQFQPTDSPMAAGTAQTGITGGSQLAPAPAPSSAPQYAAPIPAPQYAPPAAMPISGPDMAPVSAPVETVAPIVSQAVAPSFDWKIGAIIGLGVFGFMAMNKNKRGR